MFITWCESSFIINLLNINCYYPDNFIWDTYLKQNLQKCLSRNSVKFCFKINKMEMELYVVLFCFLK